MNNLTTRKIVLGMLMTLVLAFSVQGIADALTLEHRSSGGGNYQTVIPGGTFTISFTMRQAGSATNKPNYFSGSGVANMPYYLEGQNPNVRGYHPSTVADEDGTGPSTNPGDDTAASTAVARYYNDKALAITFTGLTLKKGTANVSSQAGGSRLSERTSDADALGSFSLHEAAANSNLRLSSTITLTGTAGTTAGSQEITITDVTPLADFPAVNQPASQSSIVFRIYIVTQPGLVSSPATILPTGTDGVYYGYKDVETQVDNAFGFTPDANAPVFYSVQGSGRLYVGDTTATTNPKFPLPSGGMTSSSALVYLREHTGTSRITAYVAGSPPRTVIYIYNDPSNFTRYPRLEITNGNNQTGAPGGRLEEYLEVKVTDGRGSPVSGVAVEFDSASTTSRFIPVPGTMIYTNTDGSLEDTIAEVDSVNGRVVEATSTVPGKTAADAAIFVQTDRSGLAKIYYEMGDANSANNPDIQRITASLVGVATSTFVSKEFSATVGAAGSTRVANLEIVSGNPQRAEKGSHLANPLVVVARSTGGFRIANVVIQFRTSTGTLSRHGLTAKPTEGAGAGQVPAGTQNPDSGQQIYVVTDANGQASVNYNIGQLTVAREVTAEVRRESLDPNYSFAIDRVVFNINGTGSTGGGAQEPIQRTPTTVLTVTPTPITGAPGSGQLLTINAGAGNSGITVGVGSSDEFLNASGSSIVQPAPTNVNGVTTASITLPSQEGSYGNLIVTATGYTTVLVPVTVGTATPTPTTTPATLTADTTSISGAPGSGQRVIVTARNTAGDLAEGVPVTFSIVGFDATTQSTDVFGTAAWNFTLPTRVGPYTLNITAPNYPAATVSIAVGGVAPAAGLRLFVSDGDNQTGEPGTRLSDPLVVTVVDSGNQRVSGQLVQFSVTSGGGRVSPSTATTNASGQAQTRLTLGRTAGTNTVVATLNGVSVTFTATAETAPAYLEVYDGNNQRGTVNDELADPLVVQVLDDNNNGVADVRVDFRVTSGSARLSQRGSGNALRTFTDRNGMAEAPITPTGTGTITVRAAAVGLDPVEFTITTGPPPASLTIVSGNNQAGNPGSALANPLVVEVQDAEGGAVDGVMVTFEVTAGGGSLSAETATTNAQGRAQTSLTLGDERAINSVRASVTGLDAVTFNTSVDAVIRVAASNRPVMYWIDGGALYHLSGAKAQRIAARANDIAVDMTDGKIYWIEATSDRTGRVHSSNVDGTGATVVKELTSVPMGLAHDGANDKLYLTNSWGKIQRMNADGTQFESNLLVGLGSPMDIAVSSGRVYWTDATGSVRYANTEGLKVVRNIATGSGALGGIAVDSSKVYWTEQTGNITGRIRSANLDGTGIADLFSLTAVPAGIAVGAGKVYWANGWGKVQRRNIDGSKFQDVVTGLMSPGAVAVGGANVATPTPTPTPQPGTTVRSKYDVNNDGTVDNVDAALVAGASGTNNPAYDVNDDGTVNFLDLLLVFDNREDAAGAPTVARTRLTAVQVDRIQEQIDLLLATNDRSPAALYTLTYLQSLVAAARPGKTQLLANYPNPFNPETWIPYELATDTNVKLTIYDAQGIVVRTLELGHQSAGYYTSRDRAAYWDGRNSFGELVASGLYFYQLETDEASSMRKMVILK